MSKTATFTDSERDKSLIKLIEKYKTGKKLNSFIEAVRELCETGLEIEKRK